MAENGSMKVNKHETEMNGLVFISPASHFELFKHCSDGKLSVYEHEFEQTVRPLLIIHGIKEIQIGKTDPV